MCSDTTRLSRTFAAALWPLLCALSVCLASSPADADAPMIHGVTPESEVTGPVTIWAQARGPVMTMRLRLTGPDTDLSAEAGGREVALLRDEEGRRRPWDAGSAKPGGYSLVAETYFRGRMWDSTRVDFVVPDRTPRLTAPATGRSATEPVSVADTRDPLALPAVSFKSGTPETLTRGTGAEIAFNVAGDMPRNADVLVLAWDHERREVVAGFSRIIRDQPWRIDGSAVARLPVGRLELQLHTRVNGKPVSVVKRDLTVEPQTAALPQVVFPADAPKRLTRGAMPAIELEVADPLPENGDVFVIAWSDTQKRLVDGFVLVLPESPFLITAAQLEKLPAGGVELQALTRLDGKAVSKTTHRLTVEAATPAAPPDPVVDPTPTPEPTPPVTEPVEPTPAPQDPTPSPTPSPSNGTPTTGTPNAEPVVGLTIGLAGVPATYTRGSGARIEVSLDGTLPAGADILMLAWDQDRRTMVDAFAHTLGGGERRVQNGMLDKLPSGRIELQAMLRVPNQPSTIAKRPLTVVVPEPEQPVAEQPVTDTPVTFDPPVAAAGFTAFKPSGDTRTIYVSSSSGNDLNSGLAPNAAVKTAKRGIELLRDGSPDWLLFKAGDTFTGGLGAWKKSGRGAAEKMVVGVYGGGDRPRFKTYGENGVACYDTVNHVAFVGLEFWPAKRDPASPEFNYNQIPWGEAGVLWFAKGQDILFEDCKFTYYANNMVFQSPSSAGLRDIQVRRCIVMNAYRHWDKSGGAGGHSQGIYMENVRGCVIEDSFFDHNGWNQRVSGAIRTKFNHNVYHQYNNGGAMIFRRNVMSRGSSHGLQARSGGQVEDNLFVHNAIGFFVARDPSVARRNVVLMSDDINSGDARGYGIHVLPCQDALIEQNIVAQKRGSADWAGAIEATKDDNIRGMISQNRVTARNNIVHQWTSSLGAIRKASGDASFTQSNNLVDKASGGNADPPFIDPSRDVESYLESQGQAGSLDQLAQLAGTRARNTWDARWTGPAINSHIRAGFEFAPFD